MKEIIVNNDPLLDLDAILDTPCIKETESVAAEVNDSAQDEISEKMDAEPIPENIEKPIDEFVQEEIVISERSATPEGIIDETMESNQEVIVTEMETVEIEDAVILNEEVVTEEPLVTANMETVEIEDAVIFNEEVVTEEPLITNAPFLPIVPIAIGIGAFFIFELWQVIRVHRCRRNLE